MSTGPSGCHPVRQHTARACFQEDPIPTPARGLPLLQASVQGPGAQGSLSHSVSRPSLTLPCIQVGPRWRPGRRSSSDPWWPLPCRAAPSSGQAQASSVQLGTRCPGHTSPTCQVSSGPPPERRWGRCFLGRWGSRTCTPSLSRTHTEKSSTQPPRLSPRCCHSTWVPGTPDSPRPNPLTQETKTHRHEGLRGQPSDSQSTGSA